MKIVYMIEVEFLCAVWKYHIEDLEGWLHSNIQLAISSKWV